MVRRIETGFYAASGGDETMNEGGVRVVTNCTGLCKLFLEQADQSAVTIGHTVFSLGDFSGESGERLLRHELRHVRQYEILGDAFLPLYIGPGNVTGLAGCAVTGFREKCRHDYNFFEILAD